MFYIRHCSILHEHTISFTFCPVVLANLGPKTPEIEKLPISQAKRGEELAADSRPRIREFRGRAGTRPLHELLSGCVKSVMATVLHSSSIAYSVQSLLKVVYVRDVCQAW